MRKKDLISHKFIQKIKDDYETQMDEFFRRICPDHFTDNKESNEEDNTNMDISIRNGSSG